MARSSSAETAKPIAASPTAGSGTVVRPASSSGQIPVENGVVRYRGTVGGDLAVTANGTIDQFNRTDFNDAMARQMAEFPQMA